MMTYGFPGPSCWHSKLCRSHRTVTTSFFSCFSASKSPTEMRLVVAPLIYGDMSNLIQVQNIHSRAAEKLKQANLALILC